MTRISVRSALMGVRWKDSPLRRDDSSTDISLVSPSSSRTRGDLRYRLGSGLIGDGRVGSLGRSGTDDAAKADVARRRVDRLRGARRWSVAAAIVLRTEERSALQHLARNVRRGRTAVDAALARAAARIARVAAIIRR